MHLLTCLLYLMLYLSVLDSLMGQLKLNRSVFDILLVSCSSISQTHIKQK